MYDVIVDDGMWMFRIHDKFNATTLVRYLDKLRRKYGKILVMVDGVASRCS